MLTFYWLCGTSKYVMDCHGISLALGCHYCITWWIGTWSPHYTHLWVFPGAVVPILCVIYFPKCLVLMAEIRRTSWNYIKYIILVPLHIGNLSWDPKMEVWKIIFLLNWVIFSMLIFQGVKTQVSLAFNWCLPSGFLFINKYDQQHQDQEVKINPFIHNQISACPKHCSHEMGTLCLTFLEFV